MRDERGEGCITILIIAVGCTYGLLALLALVVSLVGGDVQ